MWYASYEQVYVTPFEEDILKFDFEHMDYRLLALPDTTPFGQVTSLRTGYLSGKFESEHHSGYRKAAKKLLLPQTVKRLFFESQQSLEQEFNSLQDDAMAEFLKRREVVSSE